ncbi:hypothetical protein K431DRAFT_283302 [Polychaeton citri CBS 116435]|uniref:Mitochondrial F1F0 ATP synthase subunit Atp14 n=1 Tax=Polychaeton citri CBS 116435 TaxID=1314669 RepID=A0A9P4URZ8_9PEZI|nr:hypothetical protein K431DRAFT_283302 [Polychaeton citri CBS 116435]
MLAQSLRASRQSLARAAMQTSARRTFAATTFRSADLVQDLYLKEIKAYKSPPLKAGDADSHVQKFALPKAPASPEEANIASELKAYEDQVPEVEGQSGEPGAAPVEQDWFEEEPEEEEAHGAH